MGENKFRTFKSFYSLLVLFIGISFLMIDEFAIGTILICLSITHCYAAKEFLLPYAYTFLIHLYGIMVWLYIQNTIVYTCPNSVFTRLSLFLILSEVWIMLGSLFNKSIRQKGI